MKSSNIFTRQRMGLDNNVWAVMTLVVLMCGILLGYKFIEEKAPLPCYELNLSINGSSKFSHTVFTIDQSLIFRLYNVPVGNKINWDFGDNTANETGITVIHEFKTPGLHTVKVTLNEICISTIRVHVNPEKVMPFDTTGIPVDEPIQGNNRSTINKSEKYYTSVQADTYEWTVENENFKIRHTKEVTYEFDVDKTYIIKLVVDKGRETEKTFTKEVIVIDLQDKGSTGDYLPPNPTSPTYTPPVDAQDSVTVKSNPVPSASTGDKTNTAPEGPEIITVDESLQDYLQDYLCGYKTLTDLAPYFCKINNIAVTATTGKKTKISTNLNNLYSALNCEKDIEILSLVADRNAAHCVTHLTIRFEKKGRFERRPCSTR